MDPTDAGVRFRWFATVLVGAIAGGGAIDFALDGAATLWSFHVLFEVALLPLSLGGVAYLWLGGRDASRTIHETRIELAARRAERNAWRTRAEKTLRGLGELALETLGSSATLMGGDGGAWAKFSLNWPEVVIGGGTPNFQKNIIAERMLGLPKD